MIKTFVFIITSVFVTFTSAQLNNNWVLINANVLNFDHILTTIKPIKDSFTTVGTSISHLNGKLALYSNFYFKLNKGVLWSDYLLPRKQYSFINNSLYSNVLSKCSIGRYGLTYNTSGNRSIMPLEILTLSNSSHTDFLYFTLHTNYDITFNPISTYLNMHEIGRGNRKSIILDSGLTDFINAYQNLPNKQLALGYINPIKKSIEILELDTNNNILKKTNALIHPNLRNNELVNSNKVKFSPDGKLIGVGFYIEPEFEKTLQPLYRIYFYKYENDSQSLTLTDSIISLNYGDWEFSANSKVLYKIQNSLTSSNLAIYKIQNHALRNKIVTTLPDSFGHYYLKLTPKGSLVFISEVPNDFNTCNLNMFELLNSNSTFNLNKRFIKCKDIVNKYILQSSIYDSIKTIPCQEYFNLPNIVTTPIQNKIIGEDDSFCQNKSYTFSLTNFEENDRFHWFLNGYKIIDSLGEINLEFNNEGSFTLKAIPKNNFIDTFYKVFYVKKAAKYTLFKDTIIFNKNELTVTLPNTEFDSIWLNDEITNNQFIINSSNTFKLKFITNGCETKDSIKVNFINFIDTFTCLGDTINFKNKFKNTYLASSSLNYDTTYQKVIVNKIGDHDVIFKNVKEIKIGKLTLKAYPNFKFKDINKIICTDSSFKLNFDSSIFKNMYLNTVLQNSLNSSFETTSNNFITVETKKGCKSNFNVNIIQANCKLNYDIGCFNDTFKVKTNIGFDLKLDCKIENGLQTTFSTNLNTYTFFHTQNNYYLKRNYFKTSFDTLILRDTISFPKFSKPLPDNESICLGKNLSSILQVYNYPLNNEFNFIPLGSRSINYTFKIENCIYKDSIFIKVDTCNCFIYIPNSISINKDLLNDKFESITNCEPKELNFKLFNRWGQLISNHCVYLNGKLKFNLPENLMEGVYPYSLYLIDKWNNPMSFSGTLHLFK